MATQKKQLILEAGQKLPKKLDGLDLVIRVDPDAKPEVAAAQIKLAEEALNLGARPRIMWRGEGEKLERALKEALWAPEGVALWRLNQRVAYVRNPGMILEQPSGRLMSSDAFQRHAYANQHYDKTVERKGEKEPTLKKEQLAPRWLEWERRHELDRIVYAPGKPPIYDECWNTWRGWGCEPAKKATRADVQVFYELLEHLFGDEEPGALTWFLRWLAYPLQRPGTKLFTSVLIWGGQGVGKSLIGRTMIRIYGENSIVVTSRSLNGNFNGWAANKQFIVGEEITGSDRREHSDTLKNLITQHEVTINRKYEPEYVVPDCANYYFNSNHPDAFFLEDDDRRNFILHASRPPIYMPDKKKSEAFYKKYDRWMKGDGPTYLFRHLLDFDLGDFNPTAPALDTNAKRAMIYVGKSDLGAWCVRLREDPERALFAIGSQEKARECALFTSEELRRAYDPEQATRVTAGGVAKELSRSGFRQVNGGNSVRVGCGRRWERLWAVRDVDRWLKVAPSQIDAHYSRFEGKKVKGASK